MTPIAPISPPFYGSVCRCSGRGAHTCARYAYTFQLLLTYVSQRVHLRPSDLCLEHLDAPMVMDFLAYLEVERGNSPRTRNTR